MGGVSWSELVVIAVVALVVLGPRDMTRMFRTMGELTGKARSMAREFQKAMNDAADDAGVRDVAKTLRDTASGKSLREAVGLDSLAKDLKEAASFDAGFGGKPLPKAAGPKAAEAETDAAAGADPLANASLAATEAERLKRAERAEAARLKAAEIRARREALAAEREAAAPQTPQPSAEPPAEPRA